MTRSGRRMRAGANCPCAGAEPERKCCTAAGDGPGAPCGAPGLLAVPCILLRGKIVHVWWTVFATQYLTGERRGVLQRARPFRVGRPHSDALQLRR